MQSAFSRVTSRRIWFVPQFDVWGVPDWSEIDYLTIEQVDAVKSILFNSIGIGESSQSVKFCDLTDQRGNSLPATIKNPRVIVRPRSEHTAYVVGDETPEGFKIARSENAGGPVTVDLMIIEMGE